VRTHRTNCKTLGEKAYNSRGQGKKKAKVTLTLEDSAWCTKSSFHCRRVRFEIDREKSFEGTPG
jgi:hypothetical protein